jgi:phage tail sheath protein FI
MQTHRSPGIDWQDEAAPKARAGDRTGVPAFLGLVSRKPAFREWYRLRNAAQFDERFSVPPGGRMASAVQSFFANGGAECLIVPVDAAGRDDLISALRTLERAQGIDLLCAPDLMPNGGGSSDEVIERQALLVAHATAMGDRFVILDSPPECTPEQALQHAARLQMVLGPDAANAALYYPWVGVVRKSGPQLEWTPPCGSVAGVYARTDAAAGIEKAPANEPLEGVMDVSPRLSDEQQASFFADASVAGAVNCIRAFPGRGIRVWGVRTLSRDPAWRYINVRRLFLSAVNWMENNLTDIAFEPLGPSLWSRVRRELNAYCYSLFSRGALQGRTTSEAFFVHCDEDNNPSEMIESGRLVAEVGLAAARPYEFITIRLIRTDDAVTVTSPGDRALA